MERFLILPEIRALRWICTAILLSYCIVGFWPFNFLPRNHLGWLSGEPGLYFRRQSVAWSERAATLTGPSLQSTQAGTSTIELWLRPALEPTSNILPILTLYDGTLPENLLIAQWKSEILLRTPAWGARGERKYREVGLESALSRGTRRFIVITTGSSGTAFYVDGRLAKAYSKLILRRDSLQGRLLLGSQAQGHSGWQGKLYGLAVFKVPLSPATITRHLGLWVTNSAQALSSEPDLAALYLFDEGGGSVICDHSSSGLNLVIPQPYEVLRKVILLPPWNDSGRIFSHLEDIVVNVLGFLPFGFFYFLLRDLTNPGHRLRGAVLAVATSGGISAAIELVQVYLPTRSSSMTDLICNILGALLGVACAIVIPLYPQRLLDRLKGET